MSIIGDSAREIARKKILAHCRKVKLTPPLILQRIAEGLDATEVKTSYDKDRGRWTYSEPLIDHGHRLAAAELGIMLHDMKPCERKKIDVNLPTDIPARIVQAVKEIADYAHPE